MIDARESQVFIGEVLQPLESVLPEPEAPL